jgi:hypothetical protein
MAYSAFTDAETNARAKLRQAFFKKLKDNDAFHKSRVDQLYSGLRFFDHFNWRTDTNNRSWGAPDGEGATLGGGNGNFGWVGFNENDSLVDANYNPTRPAFSVARFTVGTLGANWAAWYSCFGLQFDQVTAPLIFEARCKLSVDGAPIYGIREMRDENPRLTDRNGIWIERADATNWRAVSYNGSRNNGVNWTKPSIGTWFVLRFEWTAGQVLIKVDGVTKDTLTSQLPVSTVLHAFFAASQNPSTCNHDFDRTELAADGLADAA